MRSQATLSDASLLASAQGYPATRTGRGRELDSSCLPRRHHVMSLRREEVDATSTSNSHPMAAAHYAGAPACVEAGGDVVPFLGVRDGGRRSALFDARGKA